MLDKTSHSIYENVLTQFMEKSVKNPAQITVEQRQIVNQIIVSVVGKVYHLTKIMTDPEEYAKKFFKLTSSKETLALGHILLKVVPDSKAFFPSSLNRRLAMALEKESYHYLKGPALRKVLKILEGEGIFFNIRGKKRVGRNLIKQRKDDGQAESALEQRQPRGGGQYSVYTLTPNVKDLLDVLSNPVAVQIVHSTLKSTTLLTKFFKLLFENLTYPLRKGDEKAQASWLKTFCATKPLRMDDSDLNTSSLQRYVTYLKNADRKTLDRWGDQFANNLMKEDNVLDTLYLLFSLPKL
jgi:hypothetical protein